MAKNKIDNNIPRYVLPYSSVYDPWSERFVMLPIDLLQCEKIQKLPPAEFKFYIACVLNKQTPKQQACLKRTLETYRRCELPGVANLTDQDIMYYSYPQKRVRPDHDYFVFPETQLEAFGYSSAYASKLLKALSRKGFIKAVYGKKTKGKGFLDPTIYEFVDTWKKQNETNFT